MASKKEEFPIKPCTIETIDVGFVDYVKDNFNIHVFTNNGFRKVPVLWVGTERAFQTKSNPEIRDSSGKLILPLISIERTSMQKDPSFKGAIQAHLPPQRGFGRDHVGGAFKVISKLNQDKTSKLQNALNATKQGTNNAFYYRYGRNYVLDEYLIPIPTYVAITYSITLRSEYQQQMNQMLLPFITKTGQVNHFVFKKDGHRFESFIQQDFAMDNNQSSMAEEERKFQTKVDIKVLGYLIGEGVNEPRPKIVRRETVAKFHTPIETVYTPGAKAVNAFNNLSSGGDEEYDNTNNNDGDPPPPGPVDLSDGYQIINGKCYIRKRLYA